MKLIPLSVFLVSLVLFPALQSVAAEKIDPALAAKVERAENLMHAGRYAEAAALYSEAYEVTSIGRGFMYHYGLCLYLSGDEQKAERIFTGVVYPGSKKWKVQTKDIDQVLAESRFHLGLIYEKRGELEKALRYFSQAKSRVAAAGLKVILLESELNKGQPAAPGQQPKKPLPAEGPGSWFWTAYQGTPEQMIELIRDYPELVKTRGPMGQTALHNAQNAAVAARLLASGADPNARDDDGATPIVIASTWDRVDLIAPLVKAGADVNARDQQGNSALLGASLEFAKALVAHGANVNNRSEFDTPLIVAVKNNPATAEFLLAKGAKVNERDIDGLTALDHAVARSSDPTIPSDKADELKKLIKALKSRGAKQGSDL